MEEINLLFAEHVLSTTRPATNVFDEDWDNLLILDACRYDLLADYDFPEGDFQSRWSGGSDSYEFLEYNVADRTLDDVVWVTANPWVSKFEDSIFEVSHVWRSGWDEDLETVPPEVVSDAAIAAERDHPHKRLVVHFMQPHYPFIGQTGREELPTHDTFADDDGHLEKGKEDVEEVWTLLQNGRVTRETLWQAYRENLELVLPHARRLATDLHGKSVLTADHGNEFGGLCFPIPYRVYGHPRGYRTENLAKVPWIVFEAQERKLIRSDQIRTADLRSSQKRRERLEVLGYYPTGELDLVYNHDLL